MPCESVSSRIEGDAIVLLGQVLDDRGEQPGIAEAAGEVGMVTAGPIEPAAG